MPIYRGAGGSGDATADSASEALLIRELVAEADADAVAAAASASAAAGSASAASSSASAASTSASNAATSASDAVTTLSTALLKANNLSDLTSASTARTNLGVTATGVDTAYAFRANNLSDLASAPTARTNLGLGTIATQAANSVAITGGSITGLSSALPIASGGTNSTATATAGGVAYGTGTAYALTAAGTAGQVLTSNGSSAPAFSTLTNNVKAWAQALGGTGTPLTINGSLNVSSITRTALGRYVVNFTTALANINYAVAASAASTQSQGIFCCPFYSAIGTISAPTTSSFAMVFIGTNGAAFDVDYVNFAVLN